MKTLFAELRASILHISNSSNKVYPMKDPVCFLPTAVPLTMYTLIACANPKSWKISTKPPSFVKAGRDFGRQYRCADDRPRYDDKRL